MGKIWVWERLAGTVWAAVVVGIFAIGGFERLELMTYDWRARAFPAEARRDIVIVAIDNPSVKAVATWPWPRAIYAELIDRLTQAGARVIAFDVDFSTERTRHDDVQFARAVSRADRVVLAAFHEHRTLDGGAVVEYANFPYPDLRKAARAVGSINLSLDPDGAIRRAPIEAPMLGGEGWSFALQTARLYLGALDRPVHRSPDGTLEIGGHRTRLGTGGEFLIRFTGGGGAFPAVSVIDVLHGTVPPATFTDKVVLVGATSLDLQDLRSTPYPGPMAGVEIQANAIATVLNGTGLFQLPAGYIISGILTILIWWTVLLAGLNVWRQQEAARRALTIAVAGCITLAAIVAAAIAAFRFEVVIDLVPLVCVGAGQVLASMLAGYVFAERRLEFQREKVEVLYRMGEETRTQPSLSRLADLLFIQVHHLLGVDRLGLDVWNEHDPSARQWHVRPPDKWVTPLPTARYADYAARVRTTGLPVAASDLIPRPPSARDGRPIRASLFIPLVAHNRVIGILHAHRERPIPFDRGEAKTLLTLATQAALNIDNGRLLDDVRTLFRRSLDAFSTALDFKDNDTGGHSKRVSLYARELACRMGMTGDDLDIVAQGALLHDVGKIAVPDHILRKPGSLSEEEWTIMRQHPDAGYRMLHTIQIPEPIAAIVRQHHERFDGGGYPSGLRGASIVAGARIFAVVDLYDAMTSDRPYRKAVSIDQVNAEMRRVAGSQLDPDVVQTFFAIPDEVLRGFRTEVAQRLTNRRAA